MMGDDKNNGRIINIPGTIHSLMIKIFLTIEIDDSSQNIQFLMHLLIAPYCKFQNNLQASSLNLNLRNAFEKNTGCWH